MRVLFDIDLCPRCLSPFTQSEVARLGGRGLKSSGDDAIRGEEERGSPRRVEQATELRGGVSGGKSTTRGVNRFREAEMR
jgi:hypothetical protein